MRAHLLFSAAILLSACTSLQRPQQAAQPHESDPKVVLSQFLRFVEREDFEGAYLLLASRWRAQYTPESLKLDYLAEPRAKELLARAAQALKSAPLLKGNQVDFSIAEGKSVQLVREEGYYRIAALE